MRMYNILYFYISVFCTDICHKQPLGEVLHSVEICFVTSLLKQTSVAYDASRVGPGTLSCLNLILERKKRNYIWLYTPYKGLSSTSTGWPTTYIHLSKWPVLIFINYSLFLAAMDIVSQHMPQVNEWPFACDVYCIGSAHIATVMLDI